jgi:serine/threonine protein kinase
MLVVDDRMVRFQACPFIARLLATSKHNGVVYHILEPLQCSLRQHLVSRDPAVSSSYIALRQLLLQLLRGLDYLHDRGWVHFDLSLDSIGVSVTA